MSEGVSVPVWGTREVEGVWRERSAGRGPRTLTQIAHASRDTLGAHATAIAHAGRVWAEPDRARQSGQVGRVRSVVGNHTTARWLRACDHGRAKTELTDASCAVRAVEDLAGLFGKAPRAYAYDRGGYSTENVKRLRKLGVRDIGLAPRGLRRLTVSVPVTYRVVCLLRWASSCLLWKTMIDLEFAKQVLKRVPLVTRVHGLAMYARFRLDLAKANWDESRLGKAVDGLPVPAPQLRHRVHGALDRASFLSIGRRCRGDIEGLLASVGQDMGRFEDVLDFGCGCGRVLRFFRDERGVSRLTGTDIDSEAIAWCRENLKIAKWDVNRDLPPTRYEDASFDFIYAISVFTHLDETFQFAWLEELRRILRPGGWAILTVHGKSLYGSLKGSERKTLEEKGFLYKVDQTGRLKLDGLPDYYQTAYHTQEYVNQQWSRFFKVVRLVDRGICSNQDAVILQKKG